MASSDNIDGALTQCRVACHAASAEFTHVRAGSVDGECVCYRPFEASPGTAEVLPGVTRHACVTANVDMPLTNDVGLQYVADCRALPKAEDSAQYANDVANGGWTAAEAREALSSGAWTLMSHDDYLCADARCTIRSTIRRDASAAGSAPAPTAIDTDGPPASSTPAAGTAVRTDAAGADSAAALAATPPAVDAGAAASAPPSSTDRQAHTARALTMTMRTPQQSSGFQFVPPVQQPPAGTSTTLTTTGNGTNSLTELVR